MPPADMRRPEPADLQGVDHLARKRTRSHRGRLHAASRAASPEPDRVRERHPRPAGSRHRSGQVSAVRRFDARLRQHRRRARHLLDAGRGVRVGGQKISRLAIGEPATPTLTVYRTPEDTSQDYHIEGLPFGTRGGMLVQHVFPVRRRVPVDDDADLRRQHVAYRLRFGAVREARSPARWRTPRRCWIGRAAGVRRRPTAAGARSPPCSSGQTRRGSRPAAASEGVAFKTTAGPHMLGVTFLQTNFAPVLDLDQHFMRDTRADRPDAGLHLLPACRHRSHRRSVQRDARRRTRRAAARFSSATRRARPTKPLCARKIITNLATQGVPASGDARRCRLR